MNDYQRIESVIRWLDERQPEQPSLSDAARAAGLSESHLHRLFSRWAGITPKGFLKAATAARAKELLRARSVLDCALDAGLSGPGRLHDLMVTVEAVTPGEWKSGGEGLEIGWDVRPSPFGECLIATTPRGVCQLEFVDAAADPRARLSAEWPRAALRRDPAAAASAAAKLFSGRGSLKALLAGTPFQLKVWRALLSIPCGKTASYGTLAGSIGAPSASRAVGSAVGANRVALLIPCHRVIRETGALGGYRWGAARKRAMLAWEAA